MDAPIEDDEILRALHTLEALDVSEDPPAGAASPLSAALPPSTPAHPLVPSWDSIVAWMVAAVPILWAARRLYRMGVLTLIHIAIRRSVRRRRRVRIADTSPVARDSREAAASDPPLRRRPSAAPERASPSRLPAPSADAEEGASATASAPGQGRPGSDEEEDEEAPPAWTPVPDAEPREKCE